MEKVRMYNFKHGLYVVQEVRTEDVKIDGCSGNGQESELFDEEKVIESQ